MPIDIENGDVVSFKSGTKCTVVKAYNNKLYAIIKDKTYILYLVEQQNNKKASKHGFKPSDNNPWKKFKIN